MAHVTSPTAEEVSALASAALAIVRAAEEVERQQQRVLQGWLRVTARAMRLAFKRRCWGLMGAHLKMIKNRGGNAGTGGG